MDIHNNEVHDIVEHARYDEQKYCGVVVVIDKSTTRTELRWATGTKQLA